MGWARTQCWPAGWPSMTPSPKVKNPQNWLKSFREGLVSTYYQMWVLPAESFNRKPFRRSFFPPLTGVANGFPLDLTRKSETFLSSLLSNVKNCCYRQNPWRRLFSPPLGVVKWISFGSMAVKKLESCSSIGWKAIGKLLSMGLLGPTLDRR